MDGIKVYDNFLEPSLLHKINEYTFKQSNKSSWNTSHRWSNDIKRFTAPIVSLDLPKEVALLIQDRFNKIKYKRKKFKINTLMFYMWPPNSYIGWHDDTCDFGASVYLNKEWNIEHGGIFLYKDKKDIKGVSPVYNRCVINVEKTMHTVSMITPDAPLRKSLQIFGEESKGNK